MQLPNVSLANLKSISLPSPLDSQKAVLDIQTQRSQLAAQQQQMAIRQRQQEKSDQIMQALSEAGGDWEAALPKIRQIDPDVALNIEKHVLSRQELQQKSAIDQFNALKGQEGEQVQVGTPGATHMPAEPEPIKSDLSKDGVPLQTPLMPSPNPSSFQTEVKNPQVTIPSIGGGPSVTARPPTAGQLRFEQLRAERQKQAEALAIKRQEPYTLNQGDVRMEGANVIGVNAPKAPTKTLPEQMADAWLQKPENVGKDLADYEAFQNAERIRIAAANKVDPEQVVNYSDNGENKIGILNKKTHVIEPLKTPEGKTADAKIAEPPAAVKTQGAAAMTALKQVDNISSIIQEHPELIGVIAGRAQTYFQGIGGNPLVGTKDERLGATLAEHLNALFAQELRSMFPGRTNEQMQELIKSTSAQMKQNPNMMMGFLDGIRKNEGMVLETAKQQGFREDIRSNTSAATGNVTYTDGGRTFSIPAAQIQEFLKDHPKAVKQ